MAEAAERLEAQSGRLRELKKLARKTAREIADAVDVTERQVQRWLAGDGDINPENLRKLAAFLGTTPDYIEYGVIRRERGDSPDPFASDGLATMLADIDHRLAHLEEQIGQLLAAVGMGDRQGDYFDLVRNTLERAISQRAREAGRKPPARAVGQGRVPQR